LTPNKPPAGSLPFRNFGTFGLDWGNADSAARSDALLGLGAGKKAPRGAKKNQAFVPTISGGDDFELRSSQLDGGGAERLLKRIVELLADPRKL